MKDLNQYQLTSTLSFEQRSKIWKDECKFYEFVTNKKPIWYQRDFLMDRSDRIAFCAGRRIGKTEMTAIKALHRAVTFPEQEIVIVAPILETASIMFDRILDFVSSNPSIDELTVRKTRTIIEFGHNKSSIKCMTAGRTGLGGRGRGPTMLIFEEAAFIPERPYVAIEMGLANIGERILIYISTPFGTRGRFYDACEEPESEFAGHVYRVTSEDSPIVSQKFLDRQKRILTESEYNQEILAQFVPESDVWIIKELFLSRSDVGLLYDPKGEMTVNEFKRADRKYFLGVDVARYGSDETVFVIGEVTNEGLMTVVYLESTGKKPLTDTVGRIVKLHKEWNFSCVYVDETGLGGGPVDMLEEMRICPKCQAYGIEIICTECKTNREDLMITINPITFTLRDKANMYRHLKWSFEKGFIKVPRSNRKLLYQTTNLPYLYTSTGILRIKLDDKMHDDFADALALCNLATLHFNEDLIIHLKGEKK